MAELNFNHRLTRRQFLKVCGLALSAALMVRIFPKRVIGQSLRAARKGIVVPYKAFSWFQAYKPNKLAG